VSKLVFDDVGGNWVSVGIGTDTCKNVPSEFWVMFSLQPRPDGTLSGEKSTATSNYCSGKQAVTFTRTGDVDVNSLPDPASQPPRVVSPAEALHGRYHETTTFAANGSQQEFDWAVRTDCLRAGDRCMSAFHAPPDQVEPLVFGGGKWTWEHEYDQQCPGGGTTHVKYTAEYPVPAPPQDPITLLTGHGHVDQTAPCAVSSDFEDKFVRTGD
jgi:serine/threonine-protein kinase